MATHNKGKPAYNKKNLMGMKFGHLTIQQGIGLNTCVNSINMFKTYECFCDACGKTMKLQTKRITNGVNHCGCLRHYNKIITENEKLGDKLVYGMKFHYLTAIKFDATKLVWEFRCDCGNTHFAKSHRVLSGHIKSCGKCLRQSAKDRLIEGKRFGLLTVVGFSSEKSLWEFVCDCGKTHFSKPKGILSGNTKSCGCLRILTGITDKFTSGMKFGRLTVVKFDITKRKWEFSCDCGEQHYSQAKHILSRDTKSCGCLYIDMINKLSSNHPKLILAKQVYNSRYKDGDLSFDEFFALTQLPCNYCGTEKCNEVIKKVSTKSRFSSYPIEDLTFSYNGIDRIDPTKAHNVDNCVPCCDICNRGKLRMPQEEFLKYLMNVSRHSITMGADDYRNISNDIDTSQYLDKSNYSMKSSAKRIAYRYRDKDFSDEKFYQLSQLDCYYCGRAPVRTFNQAKICKRSSEYAKLTGNFVYNGLDRIDNSIGHIYSNVITSCFTCNSARNNHPFDVFMRWQNMVKQFYKQ